MKHPTLYKKTSTGKIQMWKVWVEGSTIHSESGQVDGKKIKSTDLIREGKNLGKANATTAARQAEKEAEARWTKKKKKGYVESQKDAEDDKVDETIITGGYVPMKARVYQKHKKHITFPCAVQPKLDGIRCTTENGKLYTLSRQPILTVPHIVKAISESTLSDAPLDGELYNHAYKDNFEEIVHLVKRDDVHADHEKVEYHVYDCNMPKHNLFWRQLKLHTAGLDLNTASPIKIVETRNANNEEELKEIYNDFVEQGYEGAMVRNLDSLYEHKRSKHLQKYKEFMDEEFKIVGFEEGRGKLAGSIGSFVCEIDDERGRRTFKAKAKGKLAYLKVLFKDESLWKNRFMVVQFQNYSKKNHVPRFGVGVRFRDDKDF